MANRKQILIIEDEKAMLESYAEILRNAGYDVIEAEDGYKGLQALESGHSAIDLVLLDLMMAGIDGLEVLRTARGNEDTYGHVPIVVLTNMTSEKVIKEAFDGGADSYLLKTEMDQQDLLEEIAKKLGTEDQES